MKKLLFKFVCFYLIGTPLIENKKVQAFIPHYYFPSSKNLKKEADSIGKNAYQLLYFGQIKDSLKVAKLAVKVNKSDEKLWTILAETQIANNLYDDALFSLTKAESINPNISEIHFAKSSIYLKQSNINESKKSLRLGLKLQPKNFRALFQLGNIFLMEKDYKSAIDEFTNAVLIKKDFWQAINNKGLAYFELDQINQSINFFKKAILIEENAEPLLALATCLKDQNISKAISLVEKALKINPSYGDFNYRKEQLWGEKLQKSTEELFKNENLKDVITWAKTKFRETY